MKIDAYSNIKATSTTKKRSSTSSSGDFSSILGVAETEESSHTERSNNITVTSSITGMFAFQEVSDEDIHRKKLIKQGDEMLDSLEQLRRRLLLGTLSMQTLTDINQQLSLQKQEIADPNLMSIINDIELRTAVELAKLEMATKN